MVTVTEGFTPEAWPATPPPRTDPKRCSKFPPKGGAGTGPGGGALLAAVFVDGVGPEALVVVWNVGEKVEEEEEEEEDELEDEVEDEEELEDEEEDSVENEKVWEEVGAWVPEVGVGGIGNN